ncbi:MAG: GNAT family N-acetyltransferase, partial [Erysipelotrichaceae bacterium]|nr:GNAT family N-acetyltransferase [Erysipelotrichaceae bacterium]
MLREMLVEDLDQVLEIEHELFSSEWKRDDFIYELTENPFAHYCVIEENGEIIGFCGYWITFEQAQVVNVGVRE